MSQCVATAKGTGRRCERDAIQGGEVCIMHGGKAPQVQRAAKRRLAEGRARRHLDEVDVEPIDNPIAAFRDLVSEAVSLKDLLASHVASLDNLRVTDARQGEQVRAEVAAYERAMDRAGRLLSQWVGLGLQELWIVQQEKLTSDQAGLAASLAYVTFADEELDLTTEQRAVAVRVLAEYAAALALDGQLDGFVGTEEFVASLGRFADHAAKTFTAEERKAAFERMRGSMSPNDPRARAGQVVDDIRSRRAGDEVIDTTEVPAGQVPDVLEPEVETTAVVDPDRTLDPEEQDEPTEERRRRSVARHPSQGPDLRAAWSLHGERGSQLPRVAGLPAGPLVAGPPDEPPPAA